MSAMNDSTPYNVPKEPGRWRSLILAALVHLALLAFFWIGISWQSETPTTIEAEVWSPQPREAAPQPEPVKTAEAKPEPRPEPKPEPQPVVKEPPKPKVEEPPVAKPDIALEQEKKRKAQEEKQRQEQEEKEKLAKEKKRREEEEKEKLAKERERREAEEKLAREKKRLEDEKLAKLKQQEEAKKLEKEKAEKAKKEAAEKKRKQEEEADARLAAKMRDEDMRRMTGAGGSGDAPKAQGGRADGAYSQRIAAKIRSNIAFIVPESLQGNPPVEYEVRLLPDGSIAGLRKLRSSGVPGFDEAVARAIERSQPYPKDSTGGVPSSFLGIHKPKDQ